MKKIETENLKKTISIVVFLLLLFLAAFIFSQTEQKKVISTLNTKSQQGSVEFYVTDGFTGEALSQTKVVFIDTGEKYYTDEFGKTPKIIVPIIRDERYDKILPKQWGEISVIFYKEGYADYALFYLQVPLKEERNGIEILMFDKERVTNDKSLSVIEGPNMIWVNEIVDKFKDY